MLALQQAADAPRYLALDMAEDVLDRLSFLRHEPARALVIGDLTGTLAPALAAQGCETQSSDPLDLDEEQPLAMGDFDLIVSLGSLDTVNDLPGALIHLREALAPGGLMLASFIGAGSLATLRAVMLQADADRPSPRIHPQVDVRAGGQLLQRCGFADPVIDSRALRVRFGTLASLVSDLRALGLGNVLNRHGAPLGKAALARAQQAFRAHADDEGRVTETFEILTLSGWRK